MTETQPGLAYLIRTFGEYVDGPDFEGKSRTRCLKCGNQMVIYEDPQMFACDYCEWAGDAFSYVMLRESVSFKKALRMLAKTMGVKVKPHKKGKRKK